MFMEASFFSSPLVPVHENKTKKKKKKKKNEDNERTKQNQKIKK